MRRLSFAFLVLSTLVAALPAGAQQGPQAAGVIQSEPGKVYAAQVVNMSAQVAAVDKEDRIVTLKGSGGNIVDVVCGDEIKKFDTIKVGDTVNARYQESLALELKKSSSAIRERYDREVMTRPPGGEPQGKLTRTVNVVAEVMAVDPVKQTITLRGPRRTVTLPVQNPDHFKVVKVGDHVEATYTRALALSLEPAPASNK